MAAPLTLERHHALDAPFADFDDWADALIPGICSACGEDAWRGESGWWHLLHRTCPKRDVLTPEFAPDES